MIYILSAEFSRLYCDGETIASHYLRKFARFLTRNEKYSLAAKVLSLAVRWNVLWLGPRAKGNSASFRQAAVTNVLAGKPWWSILLKLTALDKK